jgi:hypothetical protein
VTSITFFRNLRAASRSMRQPPGAARPVSFLTAEAKAQPENSYRPAAAEVVVVSNFRANNAISAVWGGFGAGRLESVLLVPRALES